MCVLWSLQGSRPVYTSKGESCNSWTVCLASLIWPQRWTTHCLVSHGHTGQWSEKKESGGWHPWKSENIVYHKARGRTLFKAAQVIITHQNSLQASSFKAHRLILLWVLNKTVLPPFYARPQSKITHLYHCSKKTQLRCWQKCCFRVSSNCSLRSLPYSEDCILKKGRRGGGKQ